MINLINYGFAEDDMQVERKGTPARIIAVHKERYELVCEYGDIFGRLKSSVYYSDGDESFPTVGDFVMIQYNDSGDSLILKTLERKSKFARSDFSGHAAGYVKTVKEQIVASNFDYVFIMASLNHDYNLKRLERYLTLAWQSGAIPVVILTKADLVENHSILVEQIGKVAAGVDVFAISSKTGHGIDSLKSYLKPGKTIVFLGSSGVGKSSLVNALSGETIMTVNQIREDDSRGRHTTTHRQLIMLPNGVMIIDTPGMRELGMWEVDNGLSGAFGDVESYFGKCRFTDCQHKGEPGCAVKKAIENGELSFERWNSYLRIRQEAKFAEDKSEFLREKKAKFKTIAKYNKQYKKK